MNATAFAPALIPAPPISVVGLVDTVLAAHDAGARETAPERIASALRQRATREGIVLPERFRTPGEGKYARRLLHRDVERDLVMIAMAWGPGQGTPVHDHGGYWCVEMLVEGELEADLFRPLERRDDGLVRLQWLERELQRAGSVAVLQPPVEHHRVWNPHPRRAITLNVYGGELTSCETFRPVKYDWFLSEERRLGYDS